MWRILFLLEGGAGWRVSGTESPQSASLDKQVPLQAGLVQEDQGFST